MKKHHGLAAVLVLCLLFSQAALAFGNELQGRIATIGEDGRWVLEDMEGYRIAIIVDSQTQINMTQEIAPDNLVYVRYAEGESHPDGARRALRIEDAYFQGRVWLAEGEDNVMDINGPSQPSSILVLAPGVNAADYENKEVLFIPKIASGGHFSQRVEAANLETVDRTYGNVLEMSEDHIILDHNSTGEELRVNITESTRIPYDFSFGDYMHVFFRPQEGTPADGAIDALSIHLTHG